MCARGVCNHAVLDSVGVKPQNCVKELSHLSQNPVSDLVKIFFEAKRESLGEKGNVVNFSGNVGFTQACLNFDSSQSTCSPQFTTTVQPQIAVAKQDNC